MPGEATPDAHGDYLAAPLNRLSRLLAAGHGGQILLAQTVQQLTRGALPAGTELRDLGEHRLRDLLEPERVFQLRAPGPTGSSSRRSSRWRTVPTTCRANQRRSSAGNARHADVVSLLREMTSSC